MFASGQTIESGNPIKPGYAAAAGQTTPAMADLWRVLPSSTKTIELERDAEIVAQGVAAEYCLEIIEGCVRTCQILEDGRRQIGDFLFPGDVFGWETTGAHEYGAEAVTPVKLRRLRLSAVEERANSDLGFARDLRRYSAVQLNAARTRLVWLGRKTARERVACFLLDMASRLVIAGSSVIELPMHRADVADYLGLTIETVCRSLTEFRQHGLIAVDRGRISVLDHRGLAQAGLGQLH